MDRFERIYQLDRLLRQARYPVTVQTLCGQLECSRATLYRNIAELRDHLGAPVHYDRERGGYCYQRGDGSHYELPGLWFNPSELHGLLCAQQILAGVSPGLLEREIQPLRERIEKILAHDRLAVGDLDRHVHLSSIAVRSVAADIFRSCASAVLQRHRLRLRYHGRERDKVSERSVSPQRLTYYRDNWYLDAWCHSSAALRSFALDRIRTAESQHEASRELAPDALAHHFATSYGIFGGVRRHIAVLRFSARQARWVADEQWHPEQQGRVLDGGAYELRVPYGNPTELIMDILRYGPEVEVLAPEPLRQSVAERLRQAATHYD